MAKQPAYLGTPEEQALFEEQNRDLQQRGVHMPKPLGYTPFLKEIATGYVYPYNPRMADRSDLVIGCYNLEGSTNPADADPTKYNPKTAEMGQPPKRRSTFVPADQPSEGHAPAAEKPKRKRASRAKKPAEPVVEQKVEAAPETVEVTEPGSDADIDKLVEQFKPKE